MISYNLHFGGRILRRRLEMATAKNSQVCLITLFVRVLSLSILLSDHNNDVLISSYTVHHHVCGSRPTGAH